jgi:hypothetical protein
MFLSFISLVFAPMGTRLGYRRTGGSAAFSWASTPGVEFTL